MMRRMMLLVMLVMLVMMVEGCGKSAPVGSPAAAGAGGAELPVVSVAGSGKVLRASEGMELGQVTNQGMIHPQFRLVSEEGGAAVLFGIVANEQKRVSTPVILRCSGKGAAWKIVELKESAECEWSYAARGPGAAELWGVLAASADAVASDATNVDVNHLALMHSTDDGASWVSPARVQKVSPEAEYAGFSMAKGGSGRLTMHLAVDDDAVKHGYYHYTTLDGGKTWRGPTFEADDTVEGQELNGSLQENLRERSPFE